MKKIKNTKIVCTLGPSTDNKETLVRLIESGMNVARLNFSHGDHQEQQERIDLIKSAIDETGATIGLLLDTKGPEIRTGLMQTDVVELVQGQKTKITMDSDYVGDKDMFSVSYPELINDVEVGGHILIDDGLVDLLITGLDYDNGIIELEVVNSGVIKSRKGVNVPNVSLQLPGMTEKDKSDIIFGVKNGIDYVAVSFVRTAKDVLEVRQVLEDAGDPGVQIISKIENQEGIDNLDDILRVSDGIMVARGDLGVEIPTHEVPIIQKEIIKKCNNVGKPVITATQMLDSMQSNPRPTRAEAGDVANAIYDGTDAVMLSGETAAGNYPVEAVQTMNAICLRTEETLSEQASKKLRHFDKQDLTEAIGQAVGHTARNLGIKTIVAATASGHTAKMISKYRPNATIIAATFDDKTSRRLTLTWGVVAYKIDQPETTDEMLDSATNLVIEEGYAQEGDLILITAGVPVGEVGTTNIMKIQQIGTLLVKGEGVGNEDFIGRALVCQDSDQANQLIQPGSVLVVESTDPSYNDAIAKAGALVVEQGGITSHAAIMGLENGIPVIVGAQGACSEIAQDELITVDARRGRVYRGATTSI